MGFVEFQKVTSRYHEGDKAAGWVGKIPTVGSWREASSWAEPPFRRSEEPAPSTHGTLAHRSPKRMKLQRILLKRLDAQMDLRQSAVAEISWESRIRCSRDPSLRPKSGSGRDDPNS